MLKNIKSILKDIRVKNIISKNKEYINIGKSTILMPTFNIDIRNKTSIRPDTLVVGEKCMLSCDFIFEKDTGKISIGNNTHIGNITKLISINSIKIGDNVTISWGCTIYDHNSHSVFMAEREQDNINCYMSFKSSGDMLKNKNWDVVKSKPIVIEDDVWIGFDCVILKGVTIGRGAVVAARSVVTKDVEPYTVVAGNPAKVVKRLK